MVAVMHGEHDPKRATAQPVVLNYSNPTHSLRQHLLVLGCGGFLSLLHFGIWVQLTQYHFVRRAYFAAAPRDWPDVVFSVIIQPMHALVQLIRFRPTESDSLIGFIGLALANSLLWGFGIAYATRWTLRGLRRRVR